MIMTDTDRWQAVMATEDWAKHYEENMALTGYICLMVMPGTEHYVGLVERSFSLDRSPSHTQFFWSRAKAYDNVFGHEWIVDGFYDAVGRAANYEEWYPGATIHIIDVCDEETMPVKMDWEQWVKDSYPRPLYDPKYMFGRVNKFGSRNPKFTLKTGREFLGSVPGGTNWREKFEVMKAEKDAGGRGTRVVR